MWTLEMPPRAEWMTANDHKMAWGRRKRITEEMRRDAGLLARSMRLPRLERARIVAVVCLPSERRADPNNWNPSAKAYVDGIVDARLLDDDDTWHVLGPDMRRGDPHPVGRMILRVAELRPLLIFDAVSPAAAAEVIGHARLIAPDGVDLTDRARASGKTVTVMYESRQFAADLAGWAYSRGHTTDLACPR
jgi:hypothetical protein